MNPLRFYPECIPSFDREPLRDDFRIVSAGGEAGLAVEALKDFATGSIVFVVSGVLLREVTLRSLTLGGGLHLHDPFFYGYLSHSCDANLTFAGTDTMAFLARRPIAAGQILTWDYEETEVTLSRGFRCRCGSQSCRGWIGGKESR
jgi:uncharacterized protein